MKRAIAWINQRAGVILVGIALVGGSLYSYQVYEEQRKASCQSDYNEATSAQIGQRSRVTRALLEGISDALLQKPTTDKVEQERRQAAFLQLLVNYKREIAVALPEPPVC